MIKKRMSIVAGSMNTAKAIAEQLEEYIQDLEVTLYALEEGIGHVVKDDIVLMSSQLTYDELCGLGYCDAHSETIIANRTINYDFIDQIVSIPPGTSVLLVNDLPQTTHDVIKNMQNIGLDHLVYVAYTPGAPNQDTSIKLAITPGEADKVPDYIEMIYDIGPRLVDFTTVTQILMSVDALGEKAGLYSEAYLHKIINISKRLVASRMEVDALNQQLNGVIDALKEGLLVYDVLGTVHVANDYACQLLGIQQHLVVGKSLKDVFFNRDLINFLYDKALAGQTQIIKVEEHMLTLSKMDSRRGQIVVSIKRPEAIIEEHRAMRIELARRGHTAKYTFDHIIGKSESLAKAKFIARKLAASDLTILLQGESGTGKELFASAIHHASRRAKHAFLAINFSALPDELIESELFGYEEGAFTGAKKGGKSGLFEQADGGTLFLDEIADVSPKVQARLLRVLQEGEIMRLGGVEIKRVDVRIVAATNKPLEELVDQGKFREDLYYRLKMGFVHLPPLRKRKEDLPVLVDHFLKTESLQGMTLEASVMKRFDMHAWPGNIRELKNCLHYMMVLCDQGTMMHMHLPEYLQEVSLVQDQNRPKHPSTPYVTPEEQYILQAIAMFERQKEACGREKLAVYSKGSAYEMTKYQMRNRLEKLQEQGLISLGKGKVGAKLTQEGRDVANAIKAPL